MNEIIISINDAIWTYLLIGGLIFTGLYFTIKSRFIQFTHIKEMFRLLGEGVKSEKGSVSSFQAFCISVAARVGTGNLAGVATAIAIGGPGAVFWMWVIALIGSVSAFVESTLAQIYKQKDGTSYIGGPAYYIDKGLNKRWMAVLFAIVISVTFGLVFNSVQSNTITLAFNATFGADRMYLGAVVTLLSVLVIFGGVQRIAKVSAVIVPVMAVAYVLLALVLVVMNISHFPAVIELIITNAFGFEEVMAGGVGAAIMQGVKRGLFSNEAGMGSAPNAAATATVPHPVNQGLIQSLGVFTDTLIICSCTAFIILVSDAPLDGSIKGIELTQLAVSHQIGSLGNYFISICILFFAFSSIIGNYYYGEANIRFITPKRIYLNIYRVAVGAMIFFGSIASLDIVWSLADLTMAVMTLINLIAILLLRKVAMEALRDYNAQKKAGIKNPIYRLLGIWK
jgi:AGCS family alanine or glycine:cation symporter